MKAFFSDRQPLALPAGHRFPHSKYRLLRERIEGLADLETIESRPAADDELCLAHDAAYVRAVATGTLDPAIQRAIGFPWSEAGVERSRRSVGATIEAMRAALREGVAQNLAGGTHHAHADRGAGYCVFNDVAVAARLLQRERPGVRAVVVDLDVHQGDGTAAIFAGDARVFTVSLHGAKNFPFRKAASDLDVALPDGTGDVGYLEALDAALDAVRREHASSPFTIAFYLAGADPHEGDRLGRLALTAAGLRERDRRVLDFLHDARIAAVVAMAGGYGEEIDVTVSLQKATVEEALRSWRRWNNRAP